MLFTRPNYKVPSSSSRSGVRISGVLCPDVVREGSCGARDQPRSCNAASPSHTERHTRGMHFQTPPFGEAKLVRCTKGRSTTSSSTSARVRHFQASRCRVLTAENRRMLYIPEASVTVPELEDTPKCSIRCRNSTCLSMRRRRWDDPPSDPVANCGSHHA